MYLFRVINFQHQKDLSAKRSPVYHCCRQQLKQPNTKLLVSFINWSFNSKHSYHDVSFCSIYSHKCTIGLALKAEDGVGGECNSCLLLQEKKKKNTTNRKPQLFDVAFTCQRQLEILVTARLQTLAQPPLYCIC